LAPQEIWRAGCKVVHNTSNHGFTSAGKPWEIKYFESFENKSLTLKREIQFKNWKNRKALEELIAGD
jgi:putative endonuclease